MAKTMGKGFRTGLVILLLYVLFVLYLLFVSDRVEKLDHVSKEDSSEITLKIGK